MKVLICILLVMLSVSAFSVTLPSARKKFIKGMDVGKNTPKAAPAVKPNNEIHEYAEEMEKFVADEAVLVHEAEEVKPSGAFGKMMANSTEEIPASDSSPDARNQGEFQICPGKCGEEKRARNQTMDTGAVLVEPKEMPWVVSIKRYLVKIDNEKSDYTVLCTGTIINSRHVLSAASCFHMELKGFKDVAAYITTADLSGEKCLGTRQVIKVAEIVVPSVDNMHKQNSASPKEGGPRIDIALVRLTEDIRLGPDATTVCLGPPMDYDGVTATTVTFIDYNQNTYSLIKANTEVINRQQCSKQESVNFEDYTLCGVFSYTKEIKEYRGGHLMVTMNGSDYQVGVETATRNIYRQTAQKKFIKAEMKKFTSVPHFKSFLAEHVTGGTCE